MTTPYKEIAQLQAGAHAYFQTWERDMINFARNFLPGLRDKLGWPEEDFERLDFEKDGVPRDARWGPGGYTTNKRGYTFGVRIILGHYFLSVVFGAKKLDAETYEVTLDDDTYKVNLGHPESLDPIVTNLANALKNLVLMYELTSATRFEP